MRWRALCLPCALVEEVVEAGHGHVLADHHQVGRRVAAAQDRQHVRVREDTQLRVLLVEVPGEEEEEEEEEEDSWRCAACTP